METEDKLVHQGNVSDSVLVLTWLKGTTSTLQTEEGKGPW